MAQKTAEDKLQDKLDSYKELQSQLLKPTSNAQNILINHDQPDAHLTARNTGDNPLSSFYIYDSYIDRQDRVYLLTEYSIDVYDGTEWTHLDFGEEIPYEANSVYQDQSDNIWISTINGIFKYSTDLQLQDYNKSGFGCAFCQ
ncbi:hypothetical protein [Rhodohalobacter sp.]|uniref:hypothetical protein n=1 Tax=Rhodohalobacter sp. TaxID=1974210 RepID=UPI002ACE5049|nr:hypothetical protein [Rhodohalobacter sp.]